MWLKSSNFFKVPMLHKDKNTCIQTYTHIQEAKKELEVEEKTKEEMTG